MKKTLGWMALFVVIAAVSVYAVATQSMDFSATDFIAYVKEANVFYLLLALLSMLGFILFEGFAVLAICRAVGYPQRLKNGFVYSAADIYFSAITPSATGGQPASIWFMIKDGVPAAVAVVALVANLVFYTVAIVAIGLLTFALAPGLFFDFSVPSKLLIASGYIFLTLLGAFFVLILFKERIVHVCASGIVNALAKIKLVKNPDKLHERLQAYTRQYKECSMLIGKNWRAILLGFLFNFLQRASQITVTALATLAVGGDWGQAARAWLVQSYTVVGSNCVPIPGAMGVSDYILLDGLGNMMPQENAVHLELLSRAISFYSMIVICGIAVLISYIAVLKRKRGKEEAA